MNKTAAPNQAPQAPFAWAEFFGKLGAVSAVVAAWLFLVGWSWAYFWFGGFGVGISGIALDNRALPLWGLLAVRAYGWQIGLVAGSIYLSGALVTRARLPGDMILSLAALTLAATFAAGFKLGELKAARDREFFARSDWRGFAVVQIELAPGLVAESATLADLAQDTDGCWRVLFADTRTLYLFRPLAGPANVALPASAIDRGAIAVMRLGPVGKPACRD